MNIIAQLDLIITFVSGRPDELTDGLKPLHEIVYELQADGYTKQKITEFKEAWERLQISQELLIKEIQKGCMDSGFYYNNLNNMTK